MNIWKLPITVIIRITSLFCLFNIILFIVAIYSNIGIRLFNSIAIICLSLFEYQLYKNFEYYKILEIK